MPCEIVTGDSFPQLEEAVLEAVKNASRMAPLRPQWILSPTHLLSRHIRLKLAALAHSRPIGSVRSIPLNLLWNRFQEVAFGVKGRRWDPALDFLLFEAVSRLPSSSRLSALKGSDLGYTRLRGTFMDLADGGFGVSESSFLYEWLHSESASPFEAEVVQLYAAWLSAVEAAGFAWEPILQQKLVEWIRAAGRRSIQAALAAEESEEASILVHGFYDFTDINLELIAALGGQVDVSVFIPFHGEPSDPHPGYAFCKPALEELSLRLGNALSGISSLKKGKTPPPLLAYFIESFPDGEIPPPKPAAITYQRGSGVRAEVLSAAIRVREWLDEGVAPDDILVISTNPSKYAATLREVFASFYIPLKMLDIPVSQTPETRPLLLLEHIWEKRAPAEWIMAYLRECPELTRRRGIDCVQFEAKLRNLPFWGGEAWLELFSVINAPADRINQQGTPDFTGPERELIADICNLWVKRRKDPLPATAALHFLQEIQSWLEQPSLLQPLIEALDGLAQLRPNLLIPQATLRGLLHQPATGLTFSDPSGAPAVLLVPLMRARGLTARAMVLLGLSTQEFPPRVEEDAFLSDQTRLQIAERVRELGHRLPVKVRSREEMSLLFLLLQTSAETVHWVIPETDESGRSVAPTPWVLRYLRQWDKQPSKNVLRWKRIPVNPLGQARYLYALDPRGGSRLPPHFASALLHELPSLPVFPGTENLDRILRSRRKDPQWNGEIPSASASQRGMERVTVTQLESMARCPYRFYAAHLASFKPVRTLQVAEGMRPQPMTWGRLVHGAMEKIFAPSVERRLSALERAIEIKKLGKEYLARELEPLATGLLDGLRLFHPIFRHAYTQRLLRTVSAYLEALIEGNCSDGKPQMQETKVRVEYPGLVELGISGQIDRIDLREGRATVIDYKSGRVPEISRSALQREVNCGYRLQPTLYPWLMQTSGRLDCLADFTYLFLGNERPGEYPVSPGVSAPELLGSFSEILSQGGFYPTSGPGLEAVGIKHATPCLWCEFPSLCRRYDPLAAKSAAQLFQQCAQLRFAWLKAQLEAPVRQ